MSAEVTYTLKIGWAGRNAGNLVLGYGRIGYDKIGNQFSPAYSGTYDDVAGDLKTFSVTRGRDSGIDDMREGSLTLALWDRAGTIPGGKYNPYNTSSPIYGLIRPMRPVLFQGTVGGITYGIFQGWLTEGDDDYDWSSQTASYKFTDIFLWLNEESGPVFNVAGPCTTKDVLYAVMTAVNWPTSMCRFDTGDILPNGATGDGSRSALQIITDLMHANQGVFFFSADGYATFLDRNNWTKKTVPDATLTYQTSGHRPGFDLKKIITRSRVKYTGPGGLGVYQEYIDSDAKVEFGTIDPGEIDTPYLNGDSMAMLIANYRVNRWKSPTNPVQQVTMVEDHISTAKYVGLDLQSWVNINSTDYLIERIEMSGGGGLPHTTKWSLSNRPSNVPMAIGYGKIGTGTLGI